MTFGFHSAAVAGCSAVGLSYLVPAGLYSVVVRLFSDLASAPFPDSDLAAVAGLSAAFEQVPDYIGFRHLSDYSSEPVFMLRYI